MNLIEKSSGNESVISEQSLNKKIDVSREFNNMKKKRTLNRAKL